MDSITFQKLRDIEERFGALQAQMSDPQVAQDPSVFQKLARESKDITPVVERYRAYKDTLSELAKVQEMAKVETDPELRGEARRDVEERHRVRPAAHGQEERRAARELRLSFECAPGDRDERRRRHFLRLFTSATTVSTWLVCGNISNVSTCVMV